MYSSENKEINFEYEIISVDKNILDRINDSIKHHNFSFNIQDVNEDNITPYHLAWIKSFKNFIDEIDFNGMIDSYSSKHSDSLVRDWYYAKYAGNYSPHDIESRKLSEKYLDAKIFHNYLSVVLSIQRGTAKIVKSYEIRDKVKSLKN